MSRKLEVEIVGNTRDFDNAMDKASGKTAGFGSKLGGLAKGGAIGAAVGGVALLGKSLYDSVGAAKEAEQAQSRLEDALRSANVNYATHGTAIQGAIDKTSKLAAVDDEDLSDAFAKLVRSSGDVKGSLEGMTLATDIAAARNISLEAATKLVEKAMGGNENAFKKVGLEVEKGTTATQALQLAQEQFAGAAEAHGNTAAGAQEKLGVAFENLQEKVGQKLLPVLANLSTKLVELIAWIEENWPKFQKAMEPVMEAVRVIINNVIDRIKAIVSTIQGVITIIQGIRDGDWSKVWAGVKQVVIEGVGGMLTAMIELPAKILAALGEKAWSGLKAIGGWIGNAIVDGLSALAGRVATAVREAVSGVMGVIQPIIDAIRGLIGMAQSAASAIRSIPTPSSVVGGLLDKLPGRAAGGPVRAGSAYMVGERGPEMFVPGRSGSIVPNGGGMSSGPVYLVLKDGRLLAELVRGENAIYQRANGATG